MSEAAFFSNGARTTAVKGHPNLEDCANLKMKITNSSRLLLISVCTWVLYIAYSQKAFEAFAEACAGHGTERPQELGQLQRSREWSHEQEVRQICT